MGVKEILQEGNQANDQGGKKYSRIYGEKALMTKDDYEIFYPIKRGIIEDFDSVKYCWQHLLSHKSMHNQTKLDILVTDSPLNSKENKMKMTEYLFDRMKEHNIAIDSLNIMNSAVLSLFASGRTSGVVIESGEGITCAVPIFEGYALPHAIKSINVAGQDVTQSMLDSLVAQGVDIDNSNFEDVRKIKEQMCSVAMSYDRSVNGHDPLDEEATSYELPGDKGIIRVDHKTRYAATELLFNPDIAGLKGPGVTQIAYDSIQK
jgi:actin-related protein